MYLPLPVMVREGNALKYKLPGTGLTSLTESTTIMVSTSIALQLEEEKEEGEDEEDWHPARYTEENKRNKENIFFISF